MNKTLLVLGWTSIVWSLIVWLGFSLLLLFVGTMFSMTDRFNGANGARLWLMIGVVTALEIALAGLLTFAMRGPKPWAIGLITWFFVAGAAIGIPMGGVRSWFPTTGGLAVLFLPVVALIAMIMINKSSNN